VQPVLERGRDPEVSATTAQTPEQLGLGLGIGVHPLALGGDDVHGEQVVHRQAVLAHQVA
jgi:hypothetical protein